MRSLYGYVFFLLALSVPLADCITGCSISGYFEMGLMERLVQSSIVVYGKTTNHRANKVPLNGVLQYVIDAEFQVLCVLKRAEDRINEHITITRIAPLDNCSGTKSNAVMKVGDYSIIALRNTTVGGYYVYDEIMPARPAAVIGLKPYFFSIAKLCGMQNWQAPTGATVDSCPICGVSSFDSEVLAMDTVTYANIKNCIYNTNAVVSNMTACDLYMEESIDDVNAKSCVPDTYFQTCVQLLARAPTAVCDCSMQVETKSVRVGAGVVIAPSLLLILTLISFLIVPKRL